MSLQNHIEDESNKKSTSSFLLSLAHTVFFGNYFYGACSVALSMETLYHYKLSINISLYYVFVFFATVLFYTEAYRSVRLSGQSNLRSHWYKSHELKITCTQIVYLIICILMLIFFFNHCPYPIKNLKLAEWIILIIFPLTSVLYYGIDIKGLGSIRLRNIGLLKPFIIGFVWAGIVGIYPLYFQLIFYAVDFQFSDLGLMLFLKNMVFISILCVLFDIKDYATDSNHLIKTLVVKAGLRKTIFMFVIPLCLITLGIFTTYGLVHNFSLLRIFIQAIPFLLLLFMSYTLHKPKSILYYLILIDGLMLVKAICGIIAANMNT